MTNLPKKDPPKPCPLCRVAMQSVVTTNGTVHECLRCGTTVTVTENDSVK